MKGPVKHEINSMVLTRYLGKASPTLEAQLRRIEDNRHDGHTMGKGETRAIETEREKKSSDGARISDEAKELGETSRNGEEREGGEDDEGKKVPYGQQRPGRERGDDYSGRCLRLATPALIGQVC